MSSTTTSSHCDTSLGDGKLKLRLGASSSTLDRSWRDHKITTVSPSACLSDSDHTVTDGDPHQMNADDSKPDSPIFIITKSQLHQTNEVQFTDVFEREDFTVVRTIIRPTPSRTYFFGVFSKAASSKKNSRSASMFRIRIRSRGCSEFRDSFEEELDFFQEQRRKRIGQQPHAVKIRVEETRTVYTEDRWRDAVQALLYERARRTDSVVGHVEAC